MQKISSNEYILENFPVLYERACSDVLTKDELEGYIARAKKHLHGEMKHFHTRSRELGNIYLTLEERAAVEHLEILRNRELLAYFKVIKYLEKYCQTSKKNHLPKAMEFYREAEKIWKKLVKEMTGFIIVNLLSRKSFRLF